MNASRALGSTLGLGAALLTLACMNLSTTVNPEGIDNDGSTTVWAKLSEAGKPLPGKTVTFELTNPEICGTLGDQQKTSADAKTDETGRAAVKFKAAPDVQNCMARITVTAEGKTQDAVVKVRPAPSAVGRVDGVGALALVLIASFLIDRITRGLLFMLSFSRAWSARMPDGELEKRHRLAYLLIAGLLSTLVVAGYGKIRLFAAMGFPGIHPLLDALLTGLLLVGGADRTEGILKSLGGGGEGATRSPAPLHITGTLTLVDRDAQRSDPSTSPGPP